jgi:hypothetical protein
MMRMTKAGLVMSALLLSTTLNSAIIALPRDFPEQTQYQTSINGPANETRNSKNDAQHDQVAKDFKASIVTTTVQTVAGHSVASKETILGMDPTIALLVGFSVILVLVVGIVASSGGDRPDA